MSFGFSIGDFLAGAKLIADLTRVLSASKGASMEYQQLLMDLRCVEETLVQIDQMRLASQLHPSAINALCWIVNSTTSSIADFMLRTRKYQQSLSTKGSGNKAKDLWRKIGWSMYKPAEIKSLQQRLQLDLGSINCLLSLAACNNASLKGYYENLDDGSYVQYRRDQLPSYSDDDFGVIVHRRITQQITIGAKMANFDPTYKQPEDPDQFFRVGQAFAVLLPKQRVYKKDGHNTNQSAKTLFLSYQLPDKEQKMPSFSKPSQGSGDAWNQQISQLLSTAGDDSQPTDRESQITYESRERNKYIGEASLRRLVVVREGVNSALCLPIQTYGGRGCADQVGRKFFGILHTSNTAPSLLEGEDGITKEPVKLNVAHPADSLHTSSRINYSKLYRVDFAVRVRAIGLVDVDCVQRLVHYFEGASIRLRMGVKSVDANQAKIKGDGNETIKGSTSVSELQHLPSTDKTSDEKEGNSSVRDRHITPKLREEEDEDSMFIFEDQLNDVALDETELRMRDKASYIVEKIGQRRNHPRGILEGQNQDQDVVII
ncbi:MAG: hypothetical protein M1818_001683 [Claussenomyces sp. TS43310]|nr:MAG: hypothetical protein M1818_001683 [Claussenomyces sp. TS43310]